MTSNTSAIWKPSIEMQNWTHQSFLILPNPSEEATPPGSPINAKKWAKGNLHLETPIDIDGPDAVGSLMFPTEKGPISLIVTATIEEGTDLAKFEAIGEVKDNVPAKGAVYKLLGWAVRGEGNEIGSIRGSVVAVRGPDARPDVELGGMPIGTVGAFVITSK